MKTLTVRQLASIKRVAQNVNPLIMKREKNCDKIEKLKAENESLQAEIDGNEMGVKALTGGFSSEQLVQKVIETTDKTDAKGQPIKVTKYVPTDILEYSEEEKCYHIKEQEMMDAAFEDRDLSETFE